MIVGNTLANLSGVVLAVDETVAELLHYRPSQLLGRCYLEFTHPDDRRRNALGVARMKFGDPPLTIRKRYISGTGAPVWVDLQVSKLGNGLDAGRMVGTIQPVISPPSGEPGLLWAAAYRLLTLQRERVIELGVELFGDHAWTILLHIYLAEMECRIVDSKALSARVDIAERSAIRWINAMVAQQLVEAARPGGDAWQLTPGGIAQVERLLKRFGAD